MTAVRAGLGAIIPLQLLTTLSPLEMELRTCGLPYINLEFLKVSAPSQHSVLFRVNSPPREPKLREKPLTQATQPANGRVRLCTQVA